MDTEKRLPVSGDLDSSQFTYLLHKYAGKQISVYCSNGSRFTGTGEFAPGWVSVSREGTQEALCNLEHVVAITKQKES